MTATVGTAETVIDLRQDESAPLRHLALLRAALDDFEQTHLDRLVRWGQELAQVLMSGGRVLVAGNGGSAAQGQHLTAELVGRYLRDRRAFSAICLSAETSSITAIVNDYGGDRLFARQVEAHGRAGDVLLCLSTSGTSANVLEAVKVAAAGGMKTWALTGRAPNPLAGMVDDAVWVDADTPTVQEIHQIAIHLLCEELDRVVIDG